MSENNKKTGPNGENIDESYGANTPAATGTEGEGSAPVTGTNTSYGANSGTSASSATEDETPSSEADPTTPKNPSDILSYSEYIAEEEKRQKNLKDATYARAEEIRKQAEETARINRERAGVDAHVSYAQNMAGYGAKAESAASMGLTGGGYSDYIDAKAYATQRAEVQSARAREESAMRDAANAEANAKYQADVSYSANMSSLGRESATYHENEKAKEEQEMRNAFAADIEAGNYSTREALQSALDEAGITDGNVRSQILASWDVWNKGELDTQHSESTATVLANIEAGVYSSREQAEQAARDAGITNENTIAQLGATWDTQNNKETYDAFVADIEAGNYSTKEALEAELDKAGISGNKRTQIIAKWSKWNNGELEEEEEENKITEDNQYASYEKFSAAIDSESLDTKTADEANRLGYISPEQYASLKTKYQNAIVVSDDAFRNGDTWLSKEQAQNLIVTLNDAWAGEKKSQLQALFDQLYNVTTKGVTYFSKDNVYKDGRDGGNITVYKDGTYYGVQYSGENDDPLVKQASGSVAEGAVFKHNGKLYVKRGGHIYGIECRPVNPGAYDSLYALF